MITTTIELMLDFFAPRGARHLYLPVAQMDLRTLHQPTVNTSYMGRLELEGLDVVDSEFTEEVGLALWVC